MITTLPLTFILKYFLTRLWSTIAINQSDASLAWIPAYAGMTKRVANFLLKPTQNLPRLRKDIISRSVIPAQAGIQFAETRTTNEGFCYPINL